jgi:NADH-quinone oxidoreductase subunit B
VARCTGSKELKMGLETIFGSGLITSKLNTIINWGRKYSFLPFPFVTACCGMEFMATWGSHFTGCKFSITQMGLDAA